MDRHPVRRAPLRDGAARARRTRRVLEGLWGDQPPPGPDPEQTILRDAIAADDEDGRERGLVVQGDGLTLAALRALLLGDGTARERALALPPDLVRVLAPEVVEASLPCAPGCGQDR